MNQLTLGILTSITLVSVHTAQAQAMRDDLFGPVQGDWEVTLSGSGSSDKNFDSGGFSTSASLGYYFTDNWELVVRQGVNFSDFGQSSWNGSTRVAIDYNFNLDRWRPFVGLNFGGLYGDGVKDTFAGGLEAGVKYYVRPKTFVFGSLEYQWLFSRASRADDAFDDGQFIYGLGMGFNF